VELFSLGKDGVPRDLESEFVVTDPEGRRTGIDPRAKANYKEIPRSSYGQGDTDAPVRQLDIPEPIDGSYLLQVRATAVGPYSLYIVPSDENARSPNQPRFDNIPIEPGMIHAYRLDYTRTPGIPLKFIGGFDGGEGRPRDVNTFLTYANPIANETTLRVGKTPFPLIIFYGAAINPTSFNAALNGTDISRRFKPVPGGYQVVPLQFARGSNTLVLSVKGKTATDQEGTDADHLVFVVR
jgi:hypothetical protein